MGGWISYYQRSGSRANVACGWRLVEYCSLILFSDVAVSRDSLRVRYLAGASPFDRLCGYDCCVLSSFTRDGVSAEKNSDEYEYIGFGHRCHLCCLDSAGRRPLPKRHTLFRFKRQHQS